MSHTPGPWKARKVNNETLTGVTTIEASGIRVITPGGIWGRSIEECEANENLITAAPELLAALRETLRASPCGPHVQVAQAAIAKAMSE